MVMCKFFQQGNCRFGQSCRFEHVYPSKYSYQPNQAKQSDGSISDEHLINLVQTDVQSVLQGGQWILSAYAPFKGRPMVPGLTDLSPEEARLFVYEAKANNNLDQVLSRINQLTQEAKSMYEQLLNPNASILQVLRVLYQGNSAPSPFVQTKSDPTGASSVFRNAVQNSTVFPQNTPSVFGQTSSGNQDLSKSIFAQANQNVFGSQQQSVPSVFAQPANTPSVFNQTANATSFGQMQTGPDAPKSLFAQANQNMFGNQQNQSVSQPVFGQNTTAQSIFSAANKQQPFSSQSPFATANLPSVTNQNVNQVFGQTQRFQGNVFEQTNDEGVYGRIEDMSETDLEAFKSDMFKLGFVPELPPPKSYCVS